MASITQKIDDRDGKTIAKNTATIVLNGQTYRLDLGDENFKLIQEDLKVWTDAASVAQTRSASSGPSEGAITLDGKNVTKAQVRTWLASKDEAWFKALPVDLQTKLIMVDGVVKLTGPHYVPPAFAKALRDEALAAREAAAAQAPAKPAQPKPAAPAARKAATPKAAAK